MILSDTQLVLLNPGSLNILYRINIADIQRVSCTPYKDGLLVFHLNTQVLTVYLLLFYLRCVGNYNLLFRLYLCFYYIHFLPKNIKIYRLRKLRLKAQFIDIFEGANQAVISSIFIQWL